ncbi:hypothetical protein ACFY4C_40030 [Actinomadura viridis]|uniref:hypothetical protein n=1 Tax=Actinomadura viridis TaxID=58110 RepID=UPI003690EC83
MRWLVVGVVVATAGCGVMPSAETRATEAARDKAQRVGNVLYTRQVRTAEDIGRRAAGLDGVDVMRVSGARTHEGRGVGLVIRVEGAASEGWPIPDEITVKRCFGLRISPHREWDETPGRVRCPAGEPLTFAPPPKDPEIPAERLEEVLPRVPAGGTVDEAKVRAAVTKLRLDPAVHTEFGSRDGVVGLRLWFRPRASEALDCVLARVAPGRTSVWTPSRIQRMPGEGGCDLGNAF